MSDINKTYTAVDFERYYAGAMPEREMHELEKAALDDPFLADAMEGFLNSPVFKDDIAELKEKLQEKRKRNHTIPIISFMRSGWWRIAAIFMVVAGAGYFFYILNHRESQNSITKKETLVIKDNDSATSATDTTSNDVAFQNRDLPKSAREKSAILSSDSITYKSHRDTGKEIADASEKNSDKKPSAKYALKGKVTDEEGKPLAFATIKSESQKAITDTTGRFLLSSADSATTALASKAGYATKSVTLQEDKEPVIAMNKTNEASGEVVVSAYSQAKKSKDHNSEGKTSVTKYTNRDSTDKEKFYQYLQKNLTPIVDKNSEKITGDVLLSFTTDKKGRPCEIKVVSSSCYQCESEAIKLLKNGPDWTDKRRSGKTVLIRF
jgi:CarboxypepD_reg-like domain